MIRPLGFKLFFNHKRWIIYLLIISTLACATNTPIAQLSTARPTRTPLPTFTNTPLPPTPTPIPTSTDTATPTHTPPVTDTPTNTPVIPTDTPTPTDTPLPPPTSAPIPTPVPPTDTPTPTVTPVQVANSPVLPPTDTPVPGSPPGRYKPIKIEKRANCAHVGVIGIVKVGPDDDDDPVANVTIQVTGDEDGYRGPFYGTTASNGKYTIVIGEYGKVGRVKFKAEVFGSGADTKDEPEWTTTESCHNNDSVQVVEIKWDYDD